MIGPETRNESIDAMVRKMRKEMDFCSTKVNFFSCDGSLHSHNHVLDFSSVYLTKEMMN